VRNDYAFCAEETQKLKKLHVERCGEDRRRSLGKGKGKVWCSKSPLRGRFLWV